MGGFVLAIEGPVVGLLDGGVLGDFVGDTEILEGLTVGMAE